MEIDYMASGFSSHNFLKEGHYYRIKHFMPRMQIWMTDIVKFLELRKLQGEDALMVKIMTEKKYITIDIMRYLILTIEEIPEEELHTELFIAKL